MYSEIWHCGVVDKEIVLSKPLQELWDWLFDSRTQVNLWFEVISGSHSLFILFGLFHLNLHLQPFFMKFIGCRY